MILRNLDKMITLVPGIKRIALSRRSWDELIFDISQMQRMYFGGFDAVVSFNGDMALIKDVEVWNADAKIAPGDD